MIKLENVTKVYPGGTVALKDIDLEINKGEFVFLVGASGSGKSTLIRLMMREEAPSNGDIWVAGKHASELANWKVPHLRRSIGTVFQDFKLLPTKSVYENVAFAMEVTGKHRSVIRNQVPQVLKLVGLSAKAERLPRQLSGGEQQRVAVARAFVNRPLILLADEPTGNLDPATSVGIMRILDRINRTGTTVVMATHDHAIVDAMKRRVVQLDRGRLMRDESRGIYETREVPSVAQSPEPPVVNTPEDSRLTVEEEQELAHLDEESFDVPDILSAEELEAGLDPVDEAPAQPSETASADAEAGIASQSPDEELPVSRTSDVADSDEEPVPDDSEGEADSGEPKTMGGS